MEEKDGRLKGAVLPILASDSDDEPQDVSKEIDTSDEWEPPIRRTRTNFETGLRMGTSERTMAALGNSLRKDDGVNLEEHPEMMLTK